MHAEDGYGRQGERSDGGAEHAGRLAYPEPAERSPAHTGCFGVPKDHSGTLLNLVLR